MELKRHLLVHIDKRHKRVVHRSCCCLKIVSGALTSAELSNKLVQIQIV